MQAPTILQTPRCQSTTGKPSKSPLRWPGGKSRIAKTLIKFLPTLPSTLFSPFLGGASTELLAAAIGWQVTATDASQDLCAFWKVLLKNPQALADPVELHHPISRNQFYELQQSKPKTDLERAATLFICNRASFGGTTFSGGYYPGRFTQTAIDRLRNFTAPNLTVKSAQDFRVSIPQHDSSILFCDPPYPSACNLYGRNGGLHRDFDHQSLHDLLHGREGWMLCYPDTVQVRRWYSFATVIPLSWAWGIGRRKVGNELLILSADLAALASGNFR